MNMDICKPIRFEWDWSHLAELMQTCEYACETPYMLKYLPREGKVVEAGCGPGRFVMYLAKKGYDILGIELGQETIDKTKGVFPDLNIRQGDVTALPFADNAISGMISLGVIEHFIDGPQRVLKEMHRVLKPGAQMIVTTTSFNILRKIKYFFGFGIMNDNNWLDIKKYNFVRRLFGKKIIIKAKPLPRVPYEKKTLADRRTFFEYFFTKQEFERELDMAGFKIIESRPIQIMDGIHHELSRKLVNYDEVKFNPTFLGKALNNLFSRKLFFHNHMHLCVVTKELKNKEENKV